MKKYKYMAKLLTDNGLLTIEANKVNEEILANFSDNLGQYEKKYFDIDSFKNYIFSLQIKNMYSVYEIRG